MNTRTVTIADAHTKNRPTQVVTVVLSGGSPWFGYFWVNDVCYAIYLDDTTERVTIKRQR